MLGRSLSLCIFTNGFQFPLQSLLSLKREQTRGGDRTSPPRAACGQLQAADLILDEGAHCVRELVQ